MNYAMPVGPSSEAADRLAGEVGSSQRTYGALANEALGARSKYIAAKEYAQAYKTQRDATLRAQRRAESGSTFGNIVKTIGAIAAPLPFIGPVAKAGLGAVGSLFG